MSTPKSGHDREIPISAQLRKILEEAGPKGPDALVAVTEEGKQWGDSGLIHAFRKAQKRVGLSGFRYHDLRHLFVTELFRRGGGAPAVQQLAGHIHLSTTQKYAHVVKDDLARTIALLEGGAP